MALNATGASPINRGAFALVLLAGAAGSLAFTGHDYEVKVSLESATNVVEGTPVKVDGFAAGTVETIEVVDRRALVTLSLDKDVAPLHAGAEVLVGWKAALSERLLEVVDGPAGGAEIPNGGLLEGQMPAPTELDDILNSLDAKTRGHLQRMLADLDTTFDGRERDLNATIKSGGPTLEELGALLQAVGTDGPAIRHLVTRMNEMLEVMAARDDEVRQIVESFHAVTEEVAGSRKQLRETLKELPPTLRQANETLGLVPDAVDEAVPLLEDLEPTTETLIPVSKDLAPLLRDLRPFARDLRPTLAGLHQLLGVTPAFMDTVHAAAPDTTGVLDQAVEPVAFLRPYSPEALGFFSTWGSAFGNYDAHGHFARARAQAGIASFNSNPGVLPPGIADDPYPVPGAIVSQPWTDAHGSEIE